MQRQWEEDEDDEGADTPPPHLSPQHFLLVPVTDRHSKQLQQVVIAANSTYSKPQLTYSNR